MKSFHKIKTPKQQNTTFHVPIKNQKNKQTVSKKQKTQYKPNQSRILLKTNQNKASDVFMRSKKIQVCRR